MPRKKPSSLSRPGLDSLLGELRGLITQARQQALPKWNALRPKLNWTHYRLLLRVGLTLNPPTRLQSHSIHHPV